MRISRNCKLKTKSSGRCLRGVASWRRLRKGHPTPPASHWKRRQRRPPCLRAGSRRIGLSLAEDHRSAAVCEEQHVRGGLAHPFVKSRKDRLCVCMPSLYTSSHAHLGHAHEHGLTSRPHRMSMWLILSLSPFGALVCDVSSFASSYHPATRRVYSMNSTEGPRTPAVITGRVTLSRLTRVRAAPRSPVSGLYEFDRDGRLMSGRLPHASLYTQRARALSL